MLALFLFAVVEEDVDESAGAAVEDMEVSTTLDKVAVAAIAAEALQAACIFFHLFSIDFPRRKADCRSVILQNIVIIEKRTRIIRTLFKALKPEIRADILFS